MKAVYSILFLIAGLLYWMGGYAQQNIQVKNMTGTCVIANISPERAKENALFNAKIEALKQAGIPENLLASVTQIGGLFIEASDIEIGGDITGYEVVSDDIKIIKEGNSKVMVAEVIINANVIKYNKKRDPSFQLQVQGMKAAYREKETISFSVTPYQDGYLRIFLFEEDGTGTQLYPDKGIEPDRLFLQNVAVKFPLNDHYDYVLAKTDKAKSKEINHIFFLFLKDNIPFTENHTSLQSVSNWKAGISPDRRTQVFREFTIER